MSCLKISKNNPHLNSAPPPGIIDYPTLAEVKADPDAQAEAYGHHVMYYYLVISSSGIIISSSSSIVISCFIMYIHMYVCMYIHMCIYIYMSICIHMLFQEAFSDEHAYRQEG